MGGGWGAAGRRRSARVTPAGVVTTRKPHPSPTCVGWHGPQSAGHVPHVSPVGRWGSSHTLLPHTVRGSGGGLGRLHLGALRLQPKAPTDGPYSGRQREHGRNSPSENLLCVCVCKCVCGGGRQVRWCFARARGGGASSEHWWRRGAERLRTAVRKML